MSKYSIFVIGALLQVAVALTRFVPGIADWWLKQQQSGAILQPTATLFSIHFTFLVLTIGANAIKESTDRERWQRAMEQAAGGGTVKMLSDQEFYRDFLRRATDASFSVKIAYLAPIPPDEVKRPERLKYYKEILKLMQSRSEVNFHRLVRNTPANREWVRALAVQLAKCPNVKITLLNELDPDKADPRGMSVQIIDQAHAYLVALGGHERDDKHRDIVISHEGVARTVEKYYERLTRMGTLVFDNGRLTPEGERQLGKKG